MKELKKKLDDIKEKVRQGNITLAEHQFILLINTNSEEWQQIVISPNITKIFHYIRNIHIIQGSEVFVNLITQEISFGKDFLLDKIHSPADLLFVVFHERNHVLVNKLYKVKLNIMLADLKKKYPNVPIARLAKDAEEVFINAVNHVMIPNENLLITTFGVKGYGSLRTPRPDLEFWKNCLTLIREQQALFSEGLNNSSNSNFVQWVKLYILQIIEHNIDDGEIDISSPFQSQTSITIDTEDLNSSETTTGKGNNKVYKETFPIDPTETLNKILIDTSINSVQELQVYNLRPEEKFVISRTFQKIFTTYAANCDISYESRTPLVPSRMSRRDQFLLSQGMIPTIYAKKYYPIIRPSKFAIGFDVSGSMNHYLALLPIIYKQLAYLTNTEVCFYFSTEICSIDPAFKVFETTGGTSFNKVAEYVIKKGYSFLVIVSDGEDNLSAENVKILEKQLNHFIYIHIGNSLNNSPWFLLSKKIYKNQSIVLCECKG